MWVRLPFWVELPGKALEVTFELRPEKSKGLNPVEIWKSVPGGESSTCKGPEAGGDSMYSKPCRKAAVV